MHRRYAAWILCLLGLLTAAARGQTNLGDKPTWNFDSAGPDGKHIDLADYHGHFVVLDFWTSNISKMQFQTILDANRQYAPQGVQFIGVNFDDNKQHMLTTMTAQGITWPQYCDEKQLGSPVVATWGVKAVPYDVLIGPDGSVLWHGPSRLLADTLDEALRTIPAAPDPQAVTDALDAIDKALAGDDLAAAAKQWNQIPASAALDDKLAPRVTAMPKTLEDAAEKRLTDIDALIDQKRYVAAKAQLREIVTLMGKFPAAAKARERLAKLAKIPTAVLAAAAKAEAAAAKQPATIPAAAQEPPPPPQPPSASDALAAALKLKYAQKDLKAYAKFKTVVDNFPGTPEADRAAKEIANYEQNPDFMKKLNAGKQ